MTTRKGYSSFSAIPTETLQRLNLGQEETVTLSECLAIDFAEHWQALLPNVSIPQNYDSSMGIVKRMRFFGRALLDFDVLSHKSLMSTDTSRGWLCFQIDESSTNLAEALRGIQLFAMDHHFGVREWAWLAVRDRIVGQPLDALKLLHSWFNHENECVRRFACEATRPRGVWCAHINTFKSNPEQASDLLDSLKSDPSKYVRLSVANWLNDASKTRADWVCDTTERWLKESPTSETREIVKRSLRTIAKVDKS